MGIVDGRTWLEHMSVADCWSALAGEPVGRLAVVVDGAPVIFPVNHAVDDRSVVFRVDPGTKLNAALADSRVCYEADAYDVADRSAWSVVVKGRVEEIHDPGERREVRSLPLELWTVGPKFRWLRIRPEEVTGRRVHPDRR